jgi:hypothetical protein
MLEYFLPVTSKSDEWKYVRFFTVQIKCTLS